MVKVGGRIREIFLREVGNSKRTEFSPAMHRIDAGTLHYFTFQYQHWNSFHSTASTVQIQKLVQICFLFA